MFWVLTNDKNPFFLTKPGRFALFASNYDFAFLTDFFDACSNFHFMVPAKNNEIKSKISPYRRLVNFPGANPGVSLRVIRPRLKSYGVSSTRTESLMMT